MKQKKGKSVSEQIKALERAIEKFGDDKKGTRQARLEELKKRR